MMDLQATAGGLLVSGLEHFDLDATLDCGQCFRFERRPGGAWHGVAGGRALTVRPAGGGAVFMEQTGRGDFDGFWRRYFDLDRDYAAALAPCRSVPPLAACLRHAPGIRVLRQEAWEALASFILSQNNNIPRIKGIIGRLCRLFGPPLGGGDFAFPPAQTLAVLDEDALAPLRAGWRAAYLLDAAARVADGRLDLDAVAALPLDEARRALRAVRGVGPKVADCVLLYGMGRTDAFPMDVWMKRAMDTLCADCLPEDFGPHPGIIQQYIFHYMRAGKAG